MSTANPLANVLVLGATGGSAKGTYSWGFGIGVVEALIADAPVHGWKIRVLARPEALNVRFVIIPVGGVPANACTWALFGLQNDRKKGLLDSYKSRGVTLFTGDLQKPETLPSAFQGVNLVISCISGEGLFSQNAEQNAIRASKEAGVTRYCPSGWTYDAWEYDPLILIRRFSRHTNYCNNRTPGPVGIYKVKKENLDLIKSVGLEYTLFDTIWYEAIYFGSILGFNREKAEATVVNENARVSALSMRDCGRLAVAALTLPESKNAHLQFSGEDWTIGEWIKKFEKVQIDSVIYPSIG